MFNNQLSEEKLKHRFAVFACLHGVNTSTTADFVLPTWCHWPWSWEEMCPMCFPELCEFQSTTASDLEVQAHPIVACGHPGKKQAEPSKESPLPGHQVTTTLWHSWLLLIPPPPVTPDHLGLHSTCLNYGIFLLRGSCLFDLTEKVALRGDFSLL